MPSKNRRHADTDGRDAETAGAAGAASDGACTPAEPGSVSDPTLLAIDTSFAAGAPILFLRTIDTPALEGTTAELVTHARAAIERIQRSVYEVHDADAIVHGVPLTSQLVLIGRILRRAGASTAAL
jgi:hypothetical protein